MNTKFAGKCASVVASPLRRVRPCSFTTVRLPQRNFSPLSRSFSTCPSKQNTHLAGDHETERWRSTPVRMTAPVRSKPPVWNNAFVVNEDPQVLDKFYVKVLGKDGHRMLTNEVKWLAVTHKSFDHGRRGYNERLSFLGVMKSPHVLVGFLLMLDLNRPKNTQFTNITGSCSPLFQNPCASRHLWTSTISASGPGGTPESHYAKQESNSRRQNIRSEKAISARSTIWYRRCSTVETEEGTCRSQIATLT